MKIIKTAQFDQQQPQKIKVVPRGHGMFEAYVGKEKVGYATLSNHGSEYLLTSIDIYDHSEDGGPNYQRKGYGQQLMNYIADHLRMVGATRLRSANEGSGTVQMLDKAFGRENVKHTHGGEEIDFDTAKHIMDVDYGRTLSEVNVNPHSPEEAEERIRQQIEANEFDGDDDEEYQ